MIYRGYQEFNGKSMPTVIPRTTTHALPILVDFAGSFLEAQDRRITGTLLSSKHFAALLPGPPRVQLDVQVSL